MEPLSTTKLMGLAPIITAANRDSLVVNMPAPRDGLLMAVRTAELIWTLRRPRVALSARPEGLRRTRLARMLCRLTHRA